LKLRNLLIASAAVALLPSLAAAATPAAPAVAVAASPGDAVTRHTGLFNGQTVRYTATVSQTPIPGADGKVAATMVNTAYVRDGVKDRAERPVMFVFNGGPGASSSPLHMTALGPRRIIGTGADRHLADNPYSPLDAADLVFIDPLETGYSRLAPGVDGQQFWSVAADAATVKVFIQSWLKANGREASPHYLCGESYGTNRAAQLVATGKDLNLDGVLLIALVSGVEGPDLPFVMTLPTFAAAAVYHGKVDAAGRTPEQVFDEAATFARTDYALALLQGDRLPAADKARIAREVAKRTGLSADYVAAHNLRLDNYDFMLEVVKDKGLRTGQLDSRVTGKLEEFAGQHPPYDDPSMSLGRASKGGKSTPELMADYLKGELNYATSEPYVTLNLGINSKWTYKDEEAWSDAGGLIGRSMKEQPKLRVFWGAGLYDITTPLFAGRYTLDHAGIPADRLTALAFPAGHSIYDGDENLNRFDKAVRKFVTGG
jgi:carboxypeptidase C (cathepsin A)